MKRKRKIFATLLSLVIFAFSQICDAAIRFEVEGLTIYFSDTYILAPNDRTPYGQYVLMKEIEGGESISFTFDYDSSTGVFTLYNEGGVKYATQKFRDRDNIVFESYIWGYPSGVYTKERNGEYTYWADVDGKPFPHSMSNGSVAGFLLFLDRNGDIGGFYDKSSVITVKVPIYAPDQPSTESDNIQNSQENRSVEVSLMNQEHGRYLVKGDAEMGGLNDFSFDVKESEIYNAFGKELYFTIYEGGGKLCTLFYNQDSKTITAINPPGTNLPVHMKALILDGGKYTAGSRFSVMYHGRECWYEVVPYPDSVPK